MTTEVSEDEKLKYRQAVVSLTQSIGQAYQNLPSTLWHYTNGEALINIVKSNALWSTQISCLNDASELRYAASLAVGALEKRRESVATTPIENILYDVLFERLKADQTPYSGWFVACLTIKGDDLSQWRAYTGGGGEGGYAIGFDLPKLLNSVPAERGIIAPVEYTEQKQKEIMAQCADMTFALFNEGLKQRDGIDPRSWIEVFLKEWAMHVELIGPTLKDPAFKDESEWRIIYHLQERDREKMEYRSKSSMLVRHLPISFSDGNRHLQNYPISAVCVGPSRHNKVSIVGVNDLFLTLGHQPNSINIHPSKIPFRMT